MEKENDGLPDWSLIHSFQSNGELCAIIWYGGDEERHYQHGVLINIPSWVWTLGGQRIDHKPTGRRWSFLMLPSHFGGFLRGHEIDPAALTPGEGAELIDLSAFSKAFEPLTREQSAALTRWSHAWENQEDWEVIKIKYDPPQWRKVPLRSELLDLTPAQLEELIRTERAASRER